MEIVLDGQLTEEDVRQAIALGSPPWFQAVRVALTLVLVVPFLYSLYGLFQILFSEEMELAPTELLVLFLPGAFMLLIVALFVYVLWLLPRRQARRFLRTPLGRGRMQGMATEETLRLGSETSESTVRWDAYVRYRMSDDVVLLYQNDAAANMVPRSLFASEEDWQRFRQHVEATVPPGSTKAHPLLRWAVYGVAALIILSLIFALTGGPGGS